MVPRDSRYWWGSQVGSSHSLAQTALEGLLREPQLLNVHNKFRDFKTMFKTEHTK